MPQGLPLDGPEGPQVKRSRGSLELQSSAPSHSHGCHTDENLPIAFKWDNGWKGTSPGHPSVPSMPPDTPFSPVRQRHPMSLPRAQRAAGGLVWNGPSLSLSLPLHAESLLYAWRPGHLLQHYSPARSWWIFLTDSVKQLGSSAPRLTPIRCTINTCWMTKYTKIISPSKPPKQLTPKWWWHYANYNSKSLTNTIFTRIAPC